MKQKIILIIALLLFPFIDPNHYHLDVATNTGIYILLALGLNIIVGLTGLLNLGYAAFFAIGAYTYALLASPQLNLHFPFFIALLFSMANAAFFGVLLGTPVLRLKGDYLAIVTLGFGEIVRIAFNNLDSLTNGPDGIMQIDHPEILGYNFGVNSRPYYFLIVAGIGIVIFITRRLIDSRIGRAWIAIREDETAAGSMGINPVHLKLLALAIGASIAGLAGGIFAGKMSIVTPDSFDFMVSVMILAMVILGGMGSTKGAIFGAIVLSVLPEGLRFLAEYRMLIFGSLMLIIIIFRPQGLWGKNVSASHS